MDDICLPAFYLQRHAFELLLKRLLSWIYEYGESIGQSGKLNKGQLNRYGTSHNLSNLLYDLKVSYKLFEIAEPPQIMDDYVSELMNYETSIGKENKKIIKHNEREIRIQIVKLREQLENIISEDT